MHAHCHTFSICLSVDFQHNGITAFLNSKYDHCREYQPEKQGRVSLYIHFASVFLRPSMKYIFVNLRTNET